MSKPGVRNIDVYRGDDYTHVVTITSDGSTAVDITGRTYTAQARTEADATTVALTFTCTNSVGTDGKVTITASKTLTAALTAGSYAWDLQESASGVITTILAGACMVLRDVTRA